MLSFEEAADMVGQICDGLDFAHQHGVVHRDVKPANILLDRNGRPKITDFGVAKLTESGMTHTGTMVGTPWYMSPEQVVGEQVTGAADQFSVAVMTYQLLTRERPFTGERSSTVLYKIVHEEPVRPHLLNPKLMDQLDDVLMRAFSKNPAERFPTCNEFATELRAALGVAAARSNKTMSGATPATEWPTASMTLDKGLMKTWSEAAKSGSQSGAGSGARSGPAIERPAPQPRRWCRTRPPQPEWRRRRLLPRRRLQPLGLLQPNPRRRFHPRRSSQRGKGKRRTRRRTRARTRSRPGRRHRWPCHP